MHVWMQPWMHMGLGLVRRRPVQYAQDGVEGRAKKHHVRPCFEHVRAVSNYAQIAEQMTPCMSRMRCVIKDPGIPQSIGVKNTEEHMHRPPLKGNKFPCGKLTMLTSLSGPSFVLLTSSSSSLTLIVKSFHWINGALMDRRACISWWVNGCARELCMFHMLSG